MEDDCLICCGPRTSAAVGACGHSPLCLECCVRARVLHRDLRCVVCQAEQDWVFVTSDLAVAPPARSGKKPPPHGLLYQSPALREEAQDLLKLQCPQCRAKQPNQGALRQHLREAHQSLRLCDVCIKGRTVFHFEQRLYTKRELDVHMRKGDPPQGDDPALAPHERCKCCPNTWLFDTQALATHVRDKHFVCHLCGPANGTASPQRYYESYVVLEAHFHEEHFLCDHPDCTGRMFENVFRTAFELQAHTVQAHFKGKRGRAGKQARQLQTNFTVAANRGRGVIGPEDFGASDLPRAPMASASVSTAAAATTADAHTPPPADPRERNRELIRQLRDALGDDGYAQFRALSASFRSGDLEAEAYYHSFRDLFQNPRAAAADGTVPQTQVASLWIELVSLLPDFGKREELWAVHHREVAAGNRLNGPRSGRRGTTGRGGGGGAAAAAVGDNGRGGGRGQRPQDGNGGDGRASNSPVSDASRTSTPTLPPPPPPGLAAAPPPGSTGPTLVPSSVLAPPPGLARPPGLDAAPAAPAPTASSRPNPNAAPWPGPDGHASNPTVAAPSGAWAPPASRTTVPASSGTSGKKGKQRGRKKVVLASFG